MSDNEPYKVGASADVMAVTERTFADRLPDLIRQWPPMEWAAQSGPTAHAMWPGILLATRKACGAYGGNVYHGRVDIGRCRPWFRRLSRCPRSPLDRSNSL